MLDRLDALTVPLHHIRGNVERETAAAVEATTPSADDDLAMVTAGISAAELGADRARALGDLSLTVTLDGVSYCQATPRADDAMVTRASTPERALPLAIRAHPVLRDADVDGRLHPSEQQSRSPPADCSYRTT